jgi:hypothetical protein
MEILAILFAYSRPSIVVKVPVPAALADNPPPAVPVRGQQ